MTKGCYRNVANGEEKRTPCQASKEEGVETKGDECSPVGWILSPFQAHRNYLKIFGQNYLIHIREFLNIMTGNVIR